MQMNALIRKRKSQAFIGAVIVLVIVLSLGTALLFHSRSLRDVTRLQVNTDQAYSLAKSGMAIAQRYIDEHPTNPALNATTYNLGQGNVTVEITFDSVTKTGNITSKGRIGTSTRTLTKAFSFATAVSSCETGWAKVYSVGVDCILFSVKKTSDGGYVLGGITTAFPRRFLVMKTDSCGNVSWAKYYYCSGANSDEVLYSVEQTSDGGYILGGYTRGFSVGGGTTSSFLIIKTDANGNAGASYPGTWAKVYGGISSDFGYEAQQTPEGGYILGGTTNTFGAGAQDILLIKITSAGVPTWAKAYGTSDRERLWDLDQTDTDNDGIKDDGYILVADTNYSKGVGGDDIMIIKTDASGKVFDGSPLGWAKVYGSAVQDFPYAIKQTIPDLGYIVTGYTQASKVLLLKTDPSGTPSSPSWIKTYGPTGGDYGHALLQASDGGYLIGGDCGWDDALAIKTDSLGNISWENFYDESSGEGIRAVQEISNGYILAGASTYFSPNAGFLLMKTDSLGKVNCAFDHVVASPTASDITLTVVALAAGGGTKLTVTPVTLTVKNDIEKDPTFTVASVNPTLNTICPK